MPPEALLDSLLGYLNFSEGKPSPAFRRGLNEYFLESNDPDPWRQLGSDLRRRLDELAANSPSFQQCRQAGDAIDFAFNSVRAEYREFHADLLHHGTDAELFRPFFLARVLELALQHRGVANGARLAEVLGSLNTFVGYRPVAVLENERTMQPYPHEAVAPVAVYLRDVGASAGPYRELVDVAVRLLSQIDADLRVEACCDVEHLDELAVDPRAHDPTHPANRRPGYAFGEWDPGSADDRGSFRRFVVRQGVLDGLLAYQRQSPGAPNDGRAFESAAALAGTILLAAGMSGDRPNAHDSFTTLGTLTERVSRCRDRFYHDLLERTAGPLGERLRREAGENRQDLANVRQFLNRHLASERSAQLEEDRIAQMFARMGLSAASDRHSARVKAPATRFRCLIQIALVQGQRALDAGKVATAADVAERVENLVRRAIECGAMIDPWNILGFAGHFSLFPSPKDSVADPRVDELLTTMSRLFEFEARGLADAAFREDRHAGGRFASLMTRLARWWDAFATHEVSGVRRIVGAEWLASASFIADVLQAWRLADPAERGVAFWSRYASDFEDPQSYARVVDALLDRDDYPAALALLMHWLSRSDVVDLRGEAGTFEDCALRWMRSISDGSELPESVRAQRWQWIRRFFAQLEVNAESWWDVPSLTSFESPNEEGSAVEPFADEDDEIEWTTSESELGASEGGIADDDFTEDEDVWIEVQASIEEGLRFHQMLAQAWQIAAFAIPVDDNDSSAALAELRDECRTWCDRATHNVHALAELMDEVQSRPIARGTGSPDSIASFDRQRSSQLEVIAQAIETATEMSRAARELAKLAGGSVGAPPDRMAEEWEPTADALLLAAGQGNVDEVARCLESLKPLIASTPMLFLPLERGGMPTRIFRARKARDRLLEVLAALFRMGQFRAGHGLLESAMRAEQSAPLGEPGESRIRITQFDALFQSAYRAALDSLVEALCVWERTRDDDVQSAGAVGAFVGQFSRLWIEHLSNVRLSELERRSLDPAAWDATTRFIQKYGDEIFTQSFLHPANLRGLLNAGVETYLVHLADDPDPLKPSRLLADSHDKRTRREVVEHLEFILRSILERYDIYRDYNQSTVQSDYGSNLHIVLELARVVATYDRHAWALKPAYMAHAALIRHGRRPAARFLQQAFAEETHSLAQSLIDLSKEVERRSGVRLTSVSDRLEERFVRPLELDRMVSLVEPVLADDDPENSEAFRQLESSMETFRTSSTSGLEAPAWVRALEAEVDRRLRRSRPEPQSRPSLPAPPHTYDEFRAQLDQWAAEG